MSPCPPGCCELILILIVVPCRAVQSPTTEQHVALQGDGSLLLAPEVHDESTHHLQPPSIQPKAGLPGGASAALAGAEVGRTSRPLVWRQRLPRRLGGRYFGTAQTPRRLRQGLEIIYEPVIVREDMLTIRFEIQNFEVAVAILNRAEFADHIMQLFITSGLSKRVARMLRIRFRRKYPNIVDIYSANRPYPEGSMRELRRVLIRRPIVVDGVVGAILPACSCREACLSGTCYVTNSACATAHNDSMSSLWPAPLAPPPSLEPTGSPTAKPDARVSSTPMSSGKELRSAAKQPSSPFPLPPVNSTKDTLKARASFADVSPAALTDAANSTEVSQHAFAGGGGREMLTNEDHLLENVGDEDEDKTLHEDKDEDVNAASEAELEPRVAELERLVGTHGEDLKTLETRLARVEDETHVVEGRSASETPTPPPTDKALTPRPTPHLAPRPTPRSTTSAKRIGQNETKTEEEKKKEDGQPPLSEQAWTYCDSIGGIWREEIETLF